MHLLMAEQDLIGTDPLLQPIQQRTPQPRHGIERCPNACLRVIGLNGLDLKREGLERRGQFTGNLLALLEIREHAAQQKTQQKNGRGDHRRKQLVDADPLQTQNMHSHFDAAEHQHLEKHATDFSQTTTPRG
jgi:hypothetical protein